MRLYDIENKLAGLLDYMDARALDGQEAADEAFPQYAGLSDEGIFNAIQGLQLAREDKLECIVYAIKNAEAEAETIKSEKLRLAKKQQVAENRAARLKDFLALHTDRTAFTCLRSGLKVSWRRSEAVEVENPDFLPDEYKRTKIETVADKQVIRRAIKAGEKVPFAQLVPTYSCIIK